jgi:hypothetical protein
MVIVPMNIELPSCPICNHINNVQKVSIFVEKTFPLPSDNYIATLKDYKVVKWADKAFYVNKKYFKTKYKPISSSLLGLFANSSIEQLYKSISKSSSFQRENWVGEYTEVGQGSEKAEITALMLLPILENPSPLPKNSSFWRFFSEIIILSAFRFLLLVLIFIVSLSQNIILLAILSSILFIFMLAISTFIAILCKLAIFTLHRIQIEYGFNYEKLSQALERWEKLYYCETHDGVFGTENGIPFIHIKKVQSYLFE